MFTTLQRGLGAVGLVAASFTTLGLAPTASAAPAHPAIAYDSGNVCAGRVGVIPGDFHLCAIDRGHGRTSTGFHVVVNADSTPTCGHVLGTVTGYYPQGWTWTRSVTSGHGCSNTHSTEGQTFVANMTFKPPATLPSDLQRGVWAVQWVPDRGRPGYPTVRGVIRP